MLRRLPQLSSFIFQLGKLHLLAGFNMISFSLFKILAFKKIIFLRESVICKCQLIRLANNEWRKNHKTILGMTSSASERRQDEEETGIDCWIQFKITWQMRTKKISGHIDYASNICFTIYENKKITSNSFEWHENLKQISIRETRVILDKTQLSTVTATMKKNGENFCIRSKGPRYRLPYVKVERNKNKSSQ